MSQAAIAQMYNTTPQNITMHIKNIYEAGELVKSEKSPFYWTTYEYNENQDRGTNPYRGSHFCFRR